MMKTDIGTIRHVYQALKEEGIPLSENALRSLVATGEIPSLRSGRTVYIKLDAVKEYLNRRLSLPLEGNKTVNPDTQSLDMTS